MEIVVLFGILNLVLLGCIWRELRAIRDGLQGSGGRLGQQIEEAPPHHFRVEFESRDGRRTAPSPLGAPIGTFRNPQVRAAEYRRTNLEKLRKEERQTAKEKNADGQLS